jgi:RimJ/RimL family protein N-acetyltransferase
MSAFIKGNSVYLRAIALSDATPEYLSWLNNPDTTQGLVAGTRPSTIQDLENYLRAIGESDAVMFAICDLRNDQHIGNVKIDRFDWIARTCEFGILLGSSEHRGKGIGTEVTRLVLNYAFHTLNLQKVLLAIYGNNPAAIRAYEKSGFVLEGTLRKQVFSGGEYVDKHFMGILKEEFE